MTRYLDRSFTVPACGTPAYREGWDRVFGAGKAQSGICGCGHPAEQHAVWSPSIGCRFTRTEGATLVVCGCRKTQGEVGA